MKEINLKISPTLKRWLIDAIQELGVEHSSILLMKDESADSPESGWAMSVATTETIQLCEIDPINRVRVDGLDCIVTHPHLVQEVDGKYLIWNEEGMLLEDLH